MSYPLFALLLWSTGYALAVLLPDVDLDHEHVFTDPEYLGVGARFDRCLVCGDES